MDINHVGKGKYIGVIDNVSIWNEGTRDFGVKTWSGISLNGFSSVLCCPFGTKQFIIYHWLYVEKLFKYKRTNRIIKMQKISL